MNAEERAKITMDQLQGEIPSFDLDLRMLTLKDGSHEVNVSQRDLIVDRYATAIQTAQREAMEKCLDITTTAHKGYGSRVMIERAIRARIAELKEE